MYLFIKMLPPKKASLFYLSKKQEIAVKRRIHADHKSIAFKNRAVFVY